MDDLGLDVHLISIPVLIVHIQIRPSGIEPLNGDLKSQRLHCSAARA